MSWDLTFIYEQELTSKSMNDLLRAVIRPGVFNPNMYLYTQSGVGESGEPGVYLHIEKGTTLVFSNGRDETDSKYKRDLDVVGEYLIKAVANTAIDEFLMSTSAAPALFESAGGTGAPNAPILFVGADFLYEADNVAASSSIGFSVYRPDYTNTTIDSIVERLPNEGLDITDLSYRSQHSYLILGTILNVKATANSYVELGTWVEGGEEAWRQDHVFTGRGIPDYPRNIARDFHEDLPDLAFAKSIGRLFLTEGTINFDGSAYRFDGKTWRDMYGSEDVSYINVDPSITTGFIIDKNYTTSAQSAWSADAPSLTANKVYLTVVFLALKGKHISSAGYSLAGLLDVGTNDATWKLLPITVELNANASIITDTLSTAMDAELFGGSTGNKVPLDVSVNNISRLKDLLNNKAIFHKIIDYMRLNVDVKPYMDPTNGETLVPIFAGFRKTAVATTDFQDAATDSSGGINPVNCLTFNDMQAVPEAVLVNTISQVYNTVSILD